ncbi:MAG: peptidase T [Solobacterium sp.]|nr:peptidase T [Solobacterium sp.]
MSAEERLIRYCRIYTESDPESGTHPSAERIFDLAHLLVEELKELGLSDAAVDEHCYVYAHLPSNLNHPSKTVGFIAHMDTAPDFTGEHVNPQVIHDFNGEDIPLGNGIVTKMDDFPYMRTLKGKTLIVTDGSTLLGADDKAGITCIMEALAYYHDHPEEPHGTIAVAFTPDEEIGEGALFFDVNRMKADFAYTMDGDSVRVMSDETFHAASAEVKVAGFSIHPGEAKNKMKNAGRIAAEFIGLLPDYLTPEHTEGREGFIHLTGMEGTVEQASLSFILRDHDAGKMLGYQERLRSVQTFLNQKYGEDTVQVTFRNAYRNMKDVLKNYPEVSKVAEEAIRWAGYEPETVAVRGGTDGSEISFMGLPCPNLGNGGGNFHGRYEYCVLEELEAASVIIRRIVEKTAEMPL